MKEKLGFVTAFVTALCYNSTRTKEGIGGIPPIRHVL